MSLGLLTRASSVWRRVIGIGDQDVVWVALSHWDLCPGPHSAASTGGSQRSGEPKRLMFRGRACTESSFLAFGAGPGSGGSKRLIFKGPGLYRIVIFGLWCRSGLWQIKTTHFVIFGLWYGSGLWGGPKRLIFKGRACAESSFFSPCMSGHVMSRRVASCRIMTCHVT